MRARVLSSSALAVATCLALVGTACTDGATPDCSSPEAGCSPNLEASIDEASPSDDASDASSSETGGDAANDAPLDAADAGDAGDAHD